MLNKLFNLFSFAQRLFSSYKITGDMWSSLFLELKLLRVELNRAPQMEVNAGDKFELDIFRLTLAN